MARNYQHALGAGLGVLGESRRMSNPPARAFIHSGLRRVVKHTAGKVGNLNNGASKPDWGETISICKSVFAGFPIGSLWGRVRLSAE